MKSISGRIISFALTICIFAISISPFQFVFASQGDDTTETSAPAEPEQTQELSLSAKSAMLMDANTGKILFEKNAHEKLPPASVTKIMTLLLAMEEIESGNLKMEDTIETSTHASQMGGSQIWLKEGELMSIQDLLKATAVASANDAATLLGERIGGSEEAFVLMMNKKAQELGMNDTTFINPTGLDAAGHVSSAYDIALMSRELLKHKAITTFTTIWTATLRDGKTQLVNTNKLVRFFKGTTGLKTGTTNGAGSCISATAQRGEMNLISVVMGCPTSAQRFADARRLLEYGFSHYMMYHIKLNANSLEKIKVTHGVKDSVEVCCDIPKSIMISAGKEKSVTENIIMPPYINAPIIKGQQLGEVTIGVDENIVARFMITAKDEVFQMTFKNAFFFFLKKLFC